MINMLTPEIPMTKEENKIETSLLAAVKQSDTPLLSTMLEKHSQDISPNFKRKLVKMAVKENLLLSLNTLLGEESIFTAVADELSTQGEDDLFSSLESIFNEHEFEEEKNPLMLAQCQPIMDRLKQTPEFAFINATMKNDILTLSTFIEPPALRFSSTIRYSGLVNTAVKGHLESLALLFKSFGHYLKEHEIEFLLCVATATSNRNIVSFLLPHCNKIEEKRSLFAAAEKGNIDIFSLLFMHFTPKTDVFEMLKLMILAEDSNKPEIVNMLLSMHPKLENEEYSINKIVETLKELLQKNAESGGKYQPIIDWFVKVPAVTFLKAVLENDLKMALELLKTHASKISPSIKNKALLLALETANLPTFNALLDEPSVFATVTHNKNTVFDKAKTLTQNDSTGKYEPFIARLEQIPAVKFIALINSWSDPWFDYSWRWQEDNKLKVFLEKETNNISAEVKGEALYLAIDTWRLKCLKTLLNQCGKEISAEDKGKALQKAVESKYLSVVTLLLTDPSIVSVMMKLISEENNLSLLRAFCSLMDEKANVKDPKDKAYYSLIIRKIIQIPSLAFYHAIKQNNIEVLLNIAESHFKAIPEPIREEGLICAAKNPDGEALLHALLKYNLEEISDACRCKVLKYCVKNKHYGAIYTLIANHSVLNALSSTQSPAEEIDILKDLISCFEIKTEDQSAEENVRSQFIREKILTVPGLAFYSAIINNQLESLMLVCDKHSSKITDEMIKEGFSLAVKKGHLDIVHFTLARFENILQAHLPEALKIAAENGQVEIINTLLLNAYLFSTLKDLLSNEFLWMTENLLTLVETKTTPSLLVAEYQPFIEKNKQIPSLVFLNAIKNNQPQVMQTILDSYSIPEHIKLRGFLFAAESNLSSCLSILLSHTDSKINADQKGNALVCASKKGHLEIVTKLLDNFGKEISIESKIKALNEACLTGHADVISLLLDKCDELSITDKVEALKRALQAGQNKAALYLLNRFGNEMKKEDKGKTIIVASKAGNQEVLSILLAASEDVDIADKGEALKEAANQKTLTLLLAHCGTEINAYKGKAFESAALRGKIEIVSYLLENCSNEISAENKRTAINYAAEYENTEMLSLLFPDCDAKGFAEILKRSAMNNKVKTIVFLLDLYEGNNDIDTILFRSSALEEAAAKGYVEIVSALLNHCARHLRVYTVKQAFKRAVESGCIATVEAFLSNEVVLKCIDWSEHTLLIEAQNCAQYHKDGNLYQLIVDRLLQLPVLALYHAIKNRHIESLSTILDKHANEITPNDQYNAVSIAFNSNDVELLRLLLTTFSAAILPRDKSTLLREATYLGKYVLLEVLLENPSFQNEVENHLLDEIRYHVETARTREDSEGLQLISERLDQIAENRDAAGQNAQSMAERGQYNENSMQALSKNQIALVKVLKKHYEPIYQDKSWDVILIEIISYLESEYAKSPAKDTHGESLPLAYTEGLTPEQLKAYYQHRIHTAWRYLSVPNRWIFNESNSTILEDETRFANIDDDDKELICYLWLAINDEAVQLDEGFTVEGNKYVFAQNLGYLGRAHNYDKTRPLLDEDNHPKTNEQGEILEEYYDDLEGDKPTCERGVTQRLLEAAYGHPYIQDPAARPLSSIIVLNHMLQKLINHKEKRDDSDNLLERLNKLPLAILKALHFEISESLFLFEGELEHPLTEEENAIKIQTLTIPEEQLKRFIEDLKLFFTPQRINARTAVKHNAFKELCFKGYIPFVKHCAKNPLIAFSEQIYTFLKTKIGIKLAEAKSNSFTPAFDSNSQRREEGKEVAENGKSYQGEVQEEKDSEARKFKYEMSPQL